MLVFANITSVTFTGNTVNTLPCLLSVTVWSSCHQCSPKCTSGFKNISDVVATPSRLKFHRYTPDVGDNYSVVGYFV
jgi:hypothetical protein